MEQYIQMLKFLAYFNDFWEFIKPIIPETVGALIAIWGTLWLNNLSSRKANQAKMINLKVLLKTAIEHAETQVECLNELIEELNKNPYKMHQLNLVSTTNLKRLNLLFDDPNTFVAYIENFGNGDGHVSDYRKASNTSDYIFAKFQEVFDAYKSSVFSDLERRKAYVTYIEELLDLCTNGMEELKGAPGGIDQILSDQMANYTQSMPRLSDDIRIPQFNFVQPLLVKIETSGANYARVRQIVSHCSNVIALSNQISQQNTRLKIEFEEDLKDVRNAIAELKEQKAFENR